MDRFKNWSNGAIGTYILNNCNDEQLKDFCKLSDYKYLRGMNKDDDVNFLRNAVLHAVCLIKNEDIEKFMSSIESK